ncbi:HD-GYP domain-containing protein [Paenibacillus sp. MBLB4367]|uniref:HD-GYP domain-containing protein n=1 Tax=Paenibacillus sp. MBLB4367 TaxID=3384767 RepID=UPI0039080F6F
MRYISLDSVETGQFLGRTIFSSNGAVLLAEGVQLTVYMITTLRRIGVTMIYIKDEHFADVEIEDVVSEENKRAVMQKINETMQTVRSGKDFQTRGVSISIDRLLEDVLQNKEVLVQLSDIRTKDNEMYLHGLNVCTIATLIGINMGLNQSQLKELAIGALLHDIGKVEMITDDESKDPKLHHTWRGFELLKSKREFSLLSAHVAFQHHERPDGQGIPRKLDKDQIHQYAKIVSCANRFDNLLFDPETGKRMLPHEACERMMALSGMELDHEVLVHFMRIISVYPTGTSVRLSTRETGVVVGQHRGLPGRPVVRVVKKDDDNNLEVKEIDLAKHTTVFIEGVLT